MFLGNVFVHCFNQESTNLFIFLIVNNTWIVLSQWDILLVKVFYLTSKSLKMGYYSVYYANFKQKTDIFQMFHHLLIIVSWSDVKCIGVMCSFYVQKHKYVYMIVELFRTEPRHCIGSLFEHPVPRQHKGQDTCSPSLHSREERMDQGGACRPTEANVWVSLESMCVVMNHCYTVLSVT